MATVAEHYARLLAPVYLWMSGGWDAALARGEEDIAEFHPQRGTASIAVDLGAGFGMHAIPLARRGYSVVAIDSSAHLLAVLQENSGDLPIRCAQADLLEFLDHPSEPGELFLCMGDTITHLQDRDAVQGLFASVAKNMTSPGAFVLTFRDYTAAPMGTERFILVKSDADRILTCFLEEEREHVVVHDILHEREGSRWRMKVSSYAKLRLDPDWVVGSLESLSFRVQRRAMDRGMVRIVATRGDRAP